MTTKNSISTILSRLFGTKFFFITALSVIICCASCNESSVVGLNVQPQSDLLNVKYQDTTTIITKTVKTDSIRTDEDFTLSGLGLLGKYVDPIFGEATSSIYTQLRTSATISSNSFGTDPVCQKVVLSLVYDVTSAGLYGRTGTKKQTINVYVLSDPIIAANNYYSNNTLNHSTIDLANGFVFSPSPTDSVYVDGIKSKPQLRVPLDVNFGQTILNNQATGVLATADAFKAFIKGLYITTETTTGLAPGDGNIMRFSLNDAQSKITIYYTNLNVVARVKTFDLPLSNVSRFANFDHNNYTTGIKPVLSDQLFGTTPAANNSQLFIQAMGGLKAKIMLPYIMNMVNTGAIGINKAELVIKTDLSTYSVSEHKINGYPYASSFPPPPTLALGSIDEDGTTVDLPDLDEGSSYYGGTYNNVTHEYRFNIARYIQQVVTGTKKNLGMYLLVAPLSANIIANRVVVGGGDPASSYQMKLNISYTKLH